MFISERYQTLNLHCHYEYEKTSRQPEPLLADNEHKYDAANPMPNSLQSDFEHVHHCRHGVQILLTKRNQLRHQVPTQNHFEQAPTDLPHSEHCFHKVLHLIVRPLQPTLLLANRRTSRSPHGAMKILFIRLILRWIPHRSLACHCYICHQLSLAGWDIVYNTEVARRLNHAAQLLAEFSRQSSIIGLGEAGAPSTRRAYPRW